MLKTNSKKLVEFVKKTTVNGNIPSAIFRTTSEGMKVMVRDISNAAGVVGLLAPTTFLKFEAGLVLPIKDTKAFCSILNTFNQDVELHKVENVLKIVGENREADIILASEEFVENDLKSDFTNLSFDGGFMINANVLQQSAANATVLNVEKLTLEVKNKTLFLRAGEEQFDKITEKLGVDYVDAKSEYGDMIKRVINLLEGQINIAFKNQYPIQLVEKTQFSTIKYIVAPIITEA